MLSRLEFDEEVLSQAVRSVKTFLPNSAAVGTPLSEVCSLRVSAQLRMPLNSIIPAGWGLPARHNDSGAGRLAGPSTSCCAP